MKARKLPKIEVLQDKSFGTFETIDSAYGGSMTTVVIAKEGKVILSNARSASLSTTGIKMTYETAAVMANAILQAADLAERQGWEAPISKGE
jgi:hypothetical protein